jgi:hypothetical protein
MVTYVKKMMQRRGYYSGEFAKLPRNMTHGSRELLLAVGWLICRENVIQRFMKTCTSPLDSEPNLMMKKQVIMQTWIINNNQNYNVPYFRNI